MIVQSQLQLIKKACPNRLVPINTDPNDKVSRHHKQSEKRLTVCNAEIKVNSIDRMKDTELS